MNKFLLILCFALVFNVAKSQTDLIEIAYDYFTIILKGMTKNNGTECSDVFKNNKEKLLPYVREIIEKAKKGETLDLLSYGFLVAAIDNITVKCKIVEVYSLSDKFTSVKEIKRIGAIISNDYKEIFTYFNTLIMGQSLEEKLISVGRILSKILDFSVY